MSNSELPFLRKLLGDQWVEDEVLCDRPTHLLGLLRKNDANNLWISYVESRVMSMLISKDIIYNSEMLANKLRSRNDFLPTLAEIEYALHLAAQGFKVTLEPMAPEKGPDLRGDLEATPKSAINYLGLHAGFYCSKYQETLCSVIFRLSEHSTGIWWPDLSP